MNELFEPIKTKSLKDVFVSKFEELILSGKLAVGEKLPSERELVKQMKISRSIVHAGLLELASKELININSNSGAYINDFKRKGSLTILLPLTNYHGLKLHPKTQKDLLDLRLLFEAEAAYLSALNRTTEQLENLFSIISKEKNTKDFTIKEIVELDFDFHFSIMETSGNFFFPYLFNSFKPIYLNLVEFFYSNSAIHQTVFNFHNQLYKAIKQQNETKAKNIMIEHLKQVINTNK